MLVVNIIIFAIAAIFGLLNLIAILSDKTTSKPVVYTHGIFAAVGLILLIIFVINAAGNSPILSLVLFIIVALVGFFLFARDLSHKPGPKAVALIHGIVAVIAFIILIIFAATL
jgi:predicted tellurium resistance membrane protein TerC